MSANDTTPYRSPNVYKISNCSSKYGLKYGAQVSTEQLTLKGVKLASVETYQQTTTTKQHIPYFG